MPKNTKQIYKSDLSKNIQKQNRLVGEQDTNKKAKSFTFDELQLLINFYQRYHSPQDLPEEAGEILPYRSSRRFSSRPSKSLLLMYIFFCLIHNVSAENAVEINNNILNKLFNAIEEHSSRIEVQDYGAKEAFIEHFDKMGESLTEHYPHSLEKASKNIKKGETLLTTAANAGNDFLVRSILKEDASKVHETNSRGETALIIACKKKQQRLINFLLKAGSDPDHQDKESNSALTIASFNQDQYIMRQLLKYKADVNKKTILGTTPYIIASSRPGAIPYLTILLQNGANPNLSSGSDLFLISQNDQEEINQDILENAKKENAAILIRRQDKFSIYGDPKGDGKWEFTEIVPKDKDIDLATLPSNKGIIKRNDFLFSRPLADILKIGHPPLAHDALSAVHYATHESDPETLEFVLAQGNSYQRGYAHILPIYVAIEDGRIDNLLVLLEHSYFPMNLSEHDWTELKKGYPKGNQLKCINIFKQYYDLYNKILFSKEGSEKDFDKLGPELKQSTAVQLLKLKHLTEKGLDDSELMKDLLPKSMNHSHIFLKIAGIHLQKNNIAATRKYVEYAIKLQRESYTPFNKDEFHTNFTKVQKLFQQGNYDQALLDSKEMLKTIPDGVPDYLLQGPILELLARCELKRENFSEAKKHAHYAVIYSDLDHFFDRVKLFIEVYTHTKENHTVEKLYQQAAMTYYIYQFYDPTRYSQQTPEIKVFIETMLKPYSNYRLKHTDKNNDILLLPLIDFITSNDAFSVEERQPGISIKNAILDSRAYVHILPIYVAIQEGRIDNLLVLLDHSYFPMNPNEHDWVELKKAYPNNNQLKCINIFKQYYDLYNKIIFSKEGSEKDFDKLGPELKQSTAVQLLKLKHLTEKGLDDSELMKDLLPKSMNHSHILLKIAGIYLQKNDIAETRKYVEYAIGVQRESYTPFNKNEFHTNFTKVQKLFRQGDYDQALLDSKQMLKTIPDGVTNYLLQGPILELLARCELKRKNFSEAKEHAHYAVIYSDLDHFFDRVKLYIEVHIHTKENHTVEKLYRQAAMAYYIHQFYDPTRYSQQIPEIKIFIETMLKPYSNYTLKHTDKNNDTLLLPLIDFITSNDAFSVEEQQSAINIKNAILDSYLWTFRWTFRFFLAAPIFMLLLIILYRNNFFSKPNENIQQEAIEAPEPEPEPEIRKTRKQRREEKKEETDITYSEYKPVQTVNYELDQEKIKRFTSKVKEMGSEVSNLIWPQKATKENINVVNRKLNNLNIILDQAKKDLETYEKLNTKHLNFPEESHHYEKLLQKSFDEFGTSMVSYNNWLSTLEKPKTVQPKKEVKEFKLKEKKKPVQPIFSGNNKTEEEEQPAPSTPTKVGKQETIEPDHRFQEGYLYKKEDDRKEQTTTDKKKKISKEIKKEPYDEKTKKIINTIHVHQIEIEMNRKYIDQYVSPVLKFNIIRGLLRNFIHLSEAFLRLPEAFLDECNVDTNDMNNLRNIIRHPWGIFVYSLDPKSEDVQTLCNESIKIANLLNTRVNTIFSGKQETQIYCLKFENNPLMQYIGGLYLHNFAIPDLDLCLTRIEVEIEFIEQTIKVKPTSHADNPEVYEICRKGLIASLAFLGDSYIELRDKHTNIISRIQPRGLKYSSAVTQFINETKLRANSESTHFKLSSALEHSDEGKQNKILAMLTSKEVLKLCADISNRLGHQLFGIEIEEYNLLLKIASTVINSKKSLLEELRPLVDNTKFTSSKTYSKTFLNARSGKKTMEMDIPAPSSDAKEEVTDGEKVKLS